jgi:protein-disulfide isomerase
VSPVESDEEDLTRKQRREQARAQRKAMEQAEVASAARRTRLTQLGIIAAVVVVAIVVILIVSGGSGSSKPPPSPPSKTVGEVSAEIGGIPQGGKVLGNPAAPVTLVYFGDLQCPICKDFTLGALKSIIPQWVRTGKLKIEYRALETATHEPEVFRTQQAAALAAGKQGKMWQFLELFYRDQGEENSGYVTESFLQGLAQQVPGLNVSQWSSARNEPALANEVAADAQAANNAGFNGTPSFLIGKTGGKLSRFEYASLTDPTSFNEAIAKL